MCGLDRAGCCVARPIPQPRPGPVVARRLARSAARLARPGHSVAKSRETDILNRVKPMNTSRVARTLQRFRKQAAAPERPNSPRDSRGSADCTNFLKKENRRNGGRGCSPLCVSWNRPAPPVMPIQFSPLFRSRADDCSRSERITARYAPFLLKAGCRSYHGVDLEIDRGHRQISGSNGSAEAPMPFGEFIDSFEALSLSNCDIRDLPPPSDLFDAAFMVSTSEHFDDSARLLCDDRGAVGARQRDFHQSPQLLWLERAPSRAVARSGRQPRGSGAPSRRRLGACFGIRCATRTVRDPTNTLRFTS